MHALVDIEHVSLFLPGDAGQAPVLHDIVWTVERGGHCALLGPNGSGKSTLLRLLRGELWPSRGRILWHGPDGPEDSPLVGRAMTALVSPLQQENYQRQAWDLSGRDLLLTGFEDTPLLYTQADSARERAVEDMAARLHAGGLLARRLPTFSQGQLRLLLLGRALLRAPALLLLDECDDGLDARYRRIFFDVLEEYAARCTVVMSAHRPGAVPSWCAGRLYMREGRLSATPPVPAPPAGQGARQAAPPCRPDAAPTQGQPLLELENVSVFIERAKVLHGITWSLHQGENWRITGPNGSGKSTLLRLLAGDEFAADGGRLERLLPGEGGRVNTLEAVRRGIRLVSDLSQALYGYELNALDMVCTGFDNSIGVYRRFSTAERAEARDAMSLMFPEAATLEQLERQSIRRLSTGQLRRLFLARALMGRPDILLLDEPCSGLDAAARAAYLRLLDTLAERGMHIVFVSHHDEDAPLCINREAHMENGRLRVVR
ncbi:MAG: ATP-binding cassette domain-containing protein [Desulfovibrio desulfuricans]|jgi:molybdate transport system ATP-binding protein|nr:ATP-binding cassette domain-containing protein [Desulfovibrio desulfuricans]